MNLYVTSKRLDQVMHEVQSLGYVALDSAEREIVDAFDDGRLRLTGSSSSERNCPADEVSEDAALASEPWDSFGGAGILSGQ